MTFKIIDDIIENYTEIIVNTKLVIKTDNCSMQYKSKYTFASLKQLAMSRQIDIIWFYGEPGHGRGLVDAMSSFGVKSPLAKMIIDEDKWFDTVNEMKAELDNHFKDDETKHYHIIPAEDLLSDRRTKSKELKIPGCRKMHMITVNKGTYLQNWENNCTQIKYISSSISQNLPANGVNVNSSYRTYYIMIVRRNLCFNITYSF